ncbi:MAG: DUF3343 domain-containing protein [Candidatus Limiplasma sp.]|nr:DUF3343 domain-containing protein [Candidatus Limiplasma sp.]
MEYLVTFYTHYGAMRFHKHCRGSGVPARMMPVPRELSASCGVCVRLQAEAAPSPAEHEDMEGCFSIGPTGAFTAVEE